MIYADYIRSIVTSPVITQTVSKAIANLNLSSYISAPERFFPGPEKIYSVAGSISMLAAPAVGAGYGLIGRAVYPDAGIIPLHYAVWFSVAYLIKYCVLRIENYYEQFMGVQHYLEGLQKVHPEKLAILDKLRCHIWKITQFKNTVVKEVDEVFCGLFHVRPYTEVTAENVAHASFAEMCRFRVWSVVKATMLNVASTILAYHLTLSMGFSLPNQTDVQLFLIIQSVALSILFVPALHHYLDVSKVDHERRPWFCQFLPAL
jgi:hypothetical protein